MGKVGYVIFNVATLFTLFGLAMGTMVPVFPFLSSRL